MPFKHTCTVVLKDGHLLVQKKNLEKKPYVTPVRLQDPPSKLFCLFETQGEFEAISKFNEGIILHTP